MIVESGSELSGREGIGTENTSTGSSSSSEDMGSRWVMPSHRNCFSELTSLLREFILLMRITMHWKRSMLASGVVATRGGSVGWGASASTSEMGPMRVVWSRPQVWGMLMKVIWYQEIHELMVEGIWGQAVRRYCR